MREAEAPLITEAEAEGEEGRGFRGSTSAGGGRSGGGRGGRQYQRRSDALAYGDRYQKAAALVDLAEDGVGIPEDVLNDARFERAMRFYFVYLRLDWLWSLNLFALILFTLFGSSSSLQPNSVFLSHRSSTIFQPPASQQYFSLTPLQPPAPAPAQRTE